MSEYVEYGSLATVPGPLRCEGSTQWCFLLEADHAKLEALCRRVFAEPTGGEVDLRPLGNHVVFTLGKIDRIVSELPPFDRMGWSAEGQAAVWIPVARMSGDVADELMMFTPFMWVDNPISLPSGREMYGFNKSFGWMATGDTALELDVLGMDYGRDEAPTRRPLVRVTRGGRAHELSHIAWSGLIDAARHFRHHAVRPGLRLAESLAADLRGGGMRQVFLQQLRAIEDGHSAAFQRVTAARYEVLSFHGAPLEHEYEVSIAAIDSHPLGEELGVVSQTTSTAFRTEAAFRLEPGEALWSGARPAAAAAATAAG